MENKIDITKLKAQDFMNELPEMVMFFIFPIWQKMGRYIWSKKSKKR